MKTIRHALALLLSLQAISLNVLGQNDLYNQTQQTSPSNDKRIPKMIIKTDIGALFLYQTSTLSIGLEYPMHKKVSFENSIGYMMNSTYVYGDDRCEMQLDPSSFDFKISSGIKYYGRQSGSKRSFFMGLNLEYSHAQYQGVHWVESNWVYERFSWFGSSYGNWKTLEGHSNEFQVNVKTMGVNVSAGWHKVLFKRIPLEFGLDFHFEKTTEDVSNYEATTYPPQYPKSYGILLFIPIPIGNPSPDPPPSPSTFYTQFHFKIGYLIFKQTKS